MEIVGVIFGKLYDCVSPHASNCWKDYKNINENWKLLEEASETLHAWKSEVIQGVTKETHEVRNWLECAEKIINKIKVIGEQVKSVKFYARASLGKIVVKMIKTVKELYQEGEKIANMEKRLKELKEESGRLIARETDVRNKVTPGVTEVTNEVRYWLARVEEITKKIDGIDALVVREIDVSEMIKKVKKLYHEGEFPGRALVRKLSQRGMELPTTEILAEEATSHKMREKILVHLLDENVSKIGVFGMGGIGKTTAILHINNKLVHNPKFDKVIFVTVSKAQDLVMSLQDKIASSLELKLKKDADEKWRAGELSRYLKERKFVLILDDMWEVVSLNDVGIPEPNSENGCKLVLTTRELDVCRRMKCQKRIEMELLSEEEALNLFNNSIGDKVSTNPELKETIKLVAQECARLPLAIVAVAGSLRGNDNPLVWNIALKDLKKAGLTQLSKLMNSLKLSYDRLKDKRHQECLLYCALYPEDYPIERDLLIDQLIAVGIVDEMERGQVMLSHLVDVSLLIDTFDDSKAKCVKLHDSIRDMALQIMRENPTQFVAKAGESVESIPAEVIWNQGVKMVSLMGNKKFGISSSIEPPICPMLSSLFLNQNSLKSIPKNFFQQMLGLNVLDLSDTDIVELPESVSFLLNLSVLLLRRCGELKHVPDLSKMSNMRRLDLSHTSIEEFPKGIENMVKLTYLDLSETKLSSLPTGSLCNLTNLQYLSLVSRVSLLKITEELVNHRKLKTLRCHFAELNHFNAYVRSLAEGSLTLFTLTTGVNDHSWYPENKNVVHLVGCDTTVSSESTDFPLFLPKNVEILDMERCRINVQSLCGLTSIDNVTNLQQLRIQNCDLMYLFYYSQSIFPILERIERLELRRLPSLRDLVGIEGEGAQPSLPAGSFSSLKELNISFCRNIKKPFSLKNASFPNLEEISIRGCSELEEIVWRSRENEIEEGGAAHHTTTLDVVTLPKLKRLSLENLPKLQSIPFVADSLQFLWIDHCGKIKKLFSLKNASFPNLEKIHIRNCSQLEEIVWTSRENEIEEGGAAHHTTTLHLLTLPKLWLLKLVNLPKLQSIPLEELPAGSFSSLQYLNIWKCGNIKKLFSLKNASFPNLEEISIRGCSQLEEIVWRSRENEIEEGGAAHHTTTLHVVTLPKLKILELWNLPKLQSFPFVDKDSLQELTIRKCPNLKRIPFLDREPWHPIKQIHIDEESWSSLEWINLKDKDAYRRKLRKLNNWESEEDSDDSSEEE